MKPLLALELRATQSRIAFAALAMLMVATRYHHFGSALHFPDSSAAVFFLAGYTIPSAAALPVLLALAGVLDHLAVTVGGVSNWCVTPAYPVLFLAYAALWLAGRWCQRLRRGGARSMAEVIGTLLASSTAAFVISNVGFYALSGYFDAMSAAQYSREVAQYYPAYVGWTCFYVALAVIVRAVATALHERVAPRLNR